MLFKNLEVQLALLESTTFLGIIGFFARHSKIFHMIFVLNLVLETTLVYLFVSDRHALNLQSGPHVSAQNGNYTTGSSILSFSVVAQAC